jgi:hypothetical protein
MSNTRLTLSPTPRSPSPHDTSKLPTDRRITLARPRLWSSIELIAVDLVGCTVLGVGNSLLGAILLLPPSHSGPDYTRTRLTGRGPCKHLKQLLRYVATSCKVERVGEHTPDGL